MKSFYLALITFVFLPFMAFADENPAEQKPRSDANLTGHVENASSGEHMAYVTIAVKGTVMGTTTDATGHYFLKNLPVGEITLQAISLGYVTVEKTVRTEAGKTMELNFLLEESQERIDGVVVSATRNETNKKEAPIIVNVASARLFENTVSTNLAEAMNFQPGLRVENNCGNCGVTQLRINGLEGQYSQILLDSRPIFSSLAGVYGLEQLPVGMIERVEVVRGGGSAIFGASAIGGVVNIITKDPLRNMVSVGNTTNILRGGSTDINTSLNGSFVSDDHRAGIYVFGMLKDRQPYDRNGDGFSEIPLITSETLGFRSYYRTGAYSRLTAEYHHIHEFRRGGNNFDKPPHEADITEQLDHKIDGGGLSFNTFTPDYSHRFNIYSSAQNIRRNSYYGAEKDKTAYGNTRDLTAVAGAQYTYVMDRLLFMPAELTAGFEYNYNDLSDRIVRIDRDLEQTVHIAGAYLQNEWKNEKFSVLAGLRADKHNLVENWVLSPRGNIRYSPTEDIGLRASYSSGYRAPQAYDEDLHVEAVSEALSVITMAEGLRPEYSHSFSASADLYHNFGRVQANLLVEGFYTKLKDVFMLDLIGKNEDETILYWERRNGSGAKVKGLNFEAKVGLPGVFDIQLGYTIQSSMYDEPQHWADGLEPQRKMFRSPDHYGYLVSSLDITPSFRVSLFGNYTGSMLVRHIVNDGENETYVERDTPDFWDFGLKLAYNFSIGAGTNLELSAGVKNIFDAYQKDLDYGPYKDASYVYGPALPKMFFFGIKITM